MQEEPIEQYLCTTSVGRIHVKRERQMQEQGLRTNLGQELFGELPADGTLEAQQQFLP